MKRGENVIDLNNKENDNIINNVNQSQLEKINNSNFIFK